MSADSSYVGSIMPMWCVLVCKHRINFIFFLYDVPFWIAPWLWLGFSCAVNVISNKSRIEMLWFLYFFESKLHENWCKKIRYVSNLWDLFLMYGVKRGHHFIAIIIKCHFQGRSPTFVTSISNEYFSKMHKLFMRNDGSGFKLHFISFYCCYNS